MSEQLKPLFDWLEDYETELIDVKEVTYPDQGGAGSHRLLVLPQDNILEMIEETAAESSLEEYIARQTDEAANLTLVDALRDSLSWLTESQPPAPYSDWTTLSAAELYDAYRKLEEAEHPVSYLEEQITVTDKMLPVPDDHWAGQYAEGSVIWLTLPAGHEYEAPLLIPMGGYNECPQPVLQLAAFREWQQQYGAVPIAVDESCWILRAHQLPQTDEQALELAQQHVLFCQYMLESFNNIGEYVDYLKREPVWYFWWD